MFSGLSPRYLTVLYHPSLNKASYGTLLGTQFFQVIPPEQQLKLKGTNNSTQSFVGGIVAYKALPRPQFASLQQAIFPIYFSIQTALPVVLALTYPGERSPPRSTRSGLAGVLDAENRWQVFVPILTILSTSLANLAVIGPATTKIMRERKHQETRDGKKSYDSPPHSREMTRLNKSFGQMHGASTLLNMAGLIGTIFYGFTLAGRLH
ncbi:MAG: hypothetical protein M1836_007362 [Candelina mexicana]|nr:MAG: hypothetical protein M1836_007362 [Candelina mexicana]